MLPVEIDISDFVEKSMFTEEDVQAFKGRLLDNLASAFQNEWMNQINKTLHSTRTEYMRGMFVERPDDNSIIFGVTRRASQLAVDLELGKGPFDEKEGFERSSKKKTKKDGGWVLHIPFRHAIPTSLGESPVFTSVLPLAIYNLARRQDKPLQRSQLPSPHGIRQTRLEISDKGKTIPAYRHKSARYEGLVRVVDERENRGQYVTFRTVSDKSDWNSWWHPGLQPVGLLTKSLQGADISSVVRKTKVEFFSNR